jgi:hypothetical protein
MEKRMLVGETIEFLNQNGAEVLTDLQIRYPEAGKIIMLGTPAGDDDTPLRFGVDLTIEAMQKILIVCQKLDKKMVKNLYRAKNIEITGDIISILSGSALFILIAKGWESFSYITNGLALIGVILPKITQFFIQTLSPEGKTLAELRKTMVDLQSEAEVIYESLRFCKRAGYPENCQGEATRDLVRKGNVLSKQIRNTLKIMGVTDYPRV